MSTDGGSIGDDPKYWFGSKRDDKVRKVVGEEVPLSNYYNNLLRGTGHKYPALADIEHTRSDIETLCEIDDPAFMRWYSLREGAVLGLLNQYHLVGSVPALDLSREISVMEFRTVFTEHVTALTEAQDFLAAIKTYRDLRREYQDKRKP